MLIARLFVGTMLIFASVVIVGTAMLTATGVVGWQSAPKHAIVRYSGR